MTREITGRIQISARKLNWGLPVVVFIATFLVRLLFAWNMPFDPLRPDCREYEYLAQNLTKTGKYGYGPDWRQDPILSVSQWKQWYDQTGIQRPPGYPAVLAALELTVGNDLRVRQLVLSIVEGITAVILFYWAKMLFGSLAAVVASTLFIFNPNMCYSLVMLGREPFLTFFFVTGFCLLFLAATKERTLMFGILAGLCFGLAAYFKETIAHAGLMGAMWLLYLSYRHRTRCWQAALAILVCVPLIMAPWVLRNWRVSGRYVGFGSLINFYLSLGLVDTNPIRADLPVAFDPPEPTTALEAESRIKQELWQYVRQNPTGVAKAVADNIRGFWWPIPRRDSLSQILEKPRMAVLAIYYFTCFSFAAWSFWVLRKNRWAIFLLMVLVAITALHAIVWSGPRYRIAFDPVLLVIIGGGIQVWFERWRAARGAATKCICSV